LLDVDFIDIAKIGNGVEKKGHRPNGRCPFNPLYYKDIYLKINREIENVDPRERKVIDVDD